MIAIQHDATGRPYIVAPYVTPGSGQHLARMESVSADERKRISARNAIAIERYVPRESRFLSRLNYLGAAALVVGAAVMGCTGPSDTDALTADALNLQDAQAHARAESTISFNWKNHEPR